MYVVKACAIAIFFCKSFFSSNLLNMKNGSTARHAIFPNVNQSRKFWFLFYSRSDNFSSIANEIVSTLFNELIGPSTGSKYASYSFFIIGLFGCI
jgi:hypothetical protein